jgi:hypothetical protein
MKNYFGDWKRNSAGFILGALSDLERLAQKNWRRTGRIYGLKTSTPRQLVYC